MKLGISFFVFLQYARSLCPAIRSLSNASKLRHSFIHRIEDFLYNNAGRALSQSISTSVSILRMYFDTSFKSLGRSSKFQGKIGHHTMLLISRLSYNFTDVPKMLLGSDPQGSFTIFSIWFSLLNPVFMFCRIIKWKSSFRRQRVLSIKNLVVLLPDSYGDQALIEPDVDYLGDHHYTGCNPKKKQEEPLASLCQATMYNFNDLKRYWRCFLRLKTMWKVHFK